MNSYLGGTGCAHRSPEHSVARCDPESASLGRDERAMSLSRGTMLQVDPGLSRVIFDRRIAHGRTDPGTKRSRIIDSGRQFVGHTDWSRGGWKIEQEWL